MSTFACRLTVNLGVLFCFGPPLTFLGVLGSLWHRSEGVGDPGSWRFGELRDHGPSVHRIGLCVRPTSFARADVPLPKPYVRCSGVLHAEASRDGCCC